MPALLRPNGYPSHSILWAVPLARGPAGEGVGAPPTQQQDLRVPISVDGVSRDECSSTRQGHARRTWGYASILLSSVVIEHCKTRAVATSNWSAGSRWKPDVAIKLHPSVLHKFRHFPTGDDASSQDSIGAKFEKVAVLRLQSIRSSNPPDSNVGVQRNHCRASQSSLATGSNGSRNSRTESRRLRAAAAADPAAFETTNTSTGWPGSKGRPSTLA
jgi:hypothetical protein